MKKSSFVSILAVSIALALVLSSCAMKKPVGVSPEQPALKAAPLASENEPGGIVNPLPADDAPIDKGLYNGALDNIAAAGDDSLLASDGTYYTATVPDTIDLAERAALFVSGLTNILVFPGEGGEGKDSYGQTYYYDYMPYATGNFSGTKGVLTNYWIGGSYGCWPKDLESIALMRNISGSKLNLDRDNQSYQSILEYTQNDGSRMLLARLHLALTTIYQVSPTEELKTLIDELSRSLRKSVSEQDDYATASDGAKNDTPSARGIMGFEYNAFINGNYMRTLTRWNEIGGGSYPDAMQLASKVSNYITLSKLWEPEVERKAVYSPDLAEFNGHMHSYLTAAIGIMRYAEATHDLVLMEFAREIYEQQKNYGLANIGMYGESCGLGDMMLLASRLSLNGVGDYWDDLERYIRNSMAEIQVTDAEKLQAVLDQRDSRPTSQTQSTAPYGTTKDTTERMVGSCFGGLTYPTHIQAAEMEWIACCPGNLPQGMYYAWQSIVTESDGLVTVNLPLNRASEWLDVDSYIPYEGKIVLHNKKAEEVSFRIPNYANRAEVKVQKNGADVPFSWMGAYIYLKDLKADDEITITFPLTQWTETCTLKWREDDTRKEATDPGLANNGEPWEALEESDSFTFLFIGNTVVKIIPSVDRTTDNDTGVYKLYERDYILEATETPMKTVERFVPDSMIQF